MLQETEHILENSFTIIEFTLMKYNEMYSINWGNEKLIKKIIWCFDAEK